MENKSSGEKSELKMGGGKKSTWPLVCVLHSQALNYINIDAGKYV